MPTQSAKQNRRRNMARADQRRYCPTPWFSFACSILMVAAVIAVIVSILSSASGCAANAELVASVQADVQAVGRDLQTTIKAVESNINKTLTETNNVEGNQIVSSDRIGVVIMGVIVITLIIVVARWTKRGIIDHRIKWHTETARVKRMLDNPSLNPDYKPDASHER